MQFGGWVRRHGRKTIILMVVGLAFAALVMGPHHAATSSYDRPNRATEVTDGLNTGPLLGKRAPHSLKFAPAVNLAGANSQHETLGSA